MRFHRSIAAILALSIAFPATASDITTSPEFRLGLYPTGERLAKQIDQLVRLVKGGINPDRVAIQLPSNISPEESRAFLLYAISNLEPQLRVQDNLGEWTLFPSAGAMLAKDQTAHLQKLQSEEEQIRFVSETEVYRRGPTWQQAAMFKTIRTFHRTNEVISATKVRYFVGEESLADLPPTDRVALSAAFQETLGRGSLWHADLVGDKLRSSLVVPVTGRKSLVSTVKDPEGEGDVREEADRVAGGDFRLAALVGAFGGGHVIRLLDRLLRSKFVRKTSWELRQQIITRIRNHLAWYRTYQSKTGLWMRKVDWVRRLIPQSIPFFGLASVGPETRAGQNGTLYVLYASRPARKALAKQLKWAGGIGLAIVGIVDIAQGYQEARKSETRHGATRAIARPVYDLALTGAMMAGGKTPPGIAVFLATVGAEIANAYNPDVPTVGTFTDFLAETTADAGDLYLRRSNSAGPLEGALANDWARLRDKEDFEHLTIGSEDAPKILKLDSKEFSKETYYFARKDPKVPPEQVHNEMIRAYAWGYLVQLTKLLRFLGNVSPNQFLRYGVDHPLWLPGSLQPAYALTRHWFGWKSREAIDLEEQVAERNALRDAMSDEIDRFLAETIPLLQPAQNLGLLLAHNDDLRLRSEVEDALYRVEHCLPPVGVIQFGPGPDCRLDSDDRELASILRELSASL